MIKYKKEILLGYIAAFIATFAVMYSGKYPWITFDSWLIGIIIAGFMMKAIVFNDREDTEEE